MARLSRLRAAALASLLGLCALGGGASAEELTGDPVATGEGPLIIHPVSHATFAMSWDGKVLYNDPVGGADAFSGLPKPDLILLSDIHGDHFDVGTLQAVVQASTQLVAPAAVAEKLPQELRAKTTVLANGDKQSLLGLTIEAVPMYNTTPDRLQYHTKGRGNGYVLGIGGKRIYISGDTEDIPEMRALEEIDVAFICFNLPYTMTEEQAASAVRAFKPKIVYPYHYRGSDVDKFKSLVGQDLGIEVRTGHWY
jgi:L-ascorbate metabolism protein UlaG (beta-lactamase superfamily)